MYSQNILKDNTLPVSLFAGFQSGKSTTTVAMADGREVIPVGKGGGGIRTSAVSVTIYNDKNSTDVKIHTYSKQALVEHILESCGGQLADINASNYDLDDGLTAAIAAFLSTPIGWGVVAVLGGGAVAIIKQMYHDRELPNAVKKVGEKYKVRWENMEGNTQMIDSLVREAAEELYEMARS